MEILSIKSVKTKKSHCCWGCCEEYPSGTNMTVVVDKNDEELSNGYWCGRCTNYLKDTDQDIDFDSECLYGGLLQFEDYPR